jgi:periplasmic copper chaperone A
MSFMSYSRAAIAAAILTAASPAFAEGIEVHDAYAISSMPGAATGAAFMIIHNHGGAPDRLLDVRSDAAARVELHTHVQNADGVMQMLHVEEGFDLPTDGEILMERGGNHIMFMGLAQPFTPGEAVSVTLEFEVAGDVTIEIPVGEPGMEGSGMDHGHMDHGAAEPAVTE